MSDAKKLHKKGVHTVCAEVENKEVGRSKDHRGAWGNLKGDVYVHYLWCEDVTIVWTQLQH